MKASTHSGPSARSNKAPSYAFSRSEGKYPYRQADGVCVCPPSVPPRGRSLFAAFLLLVQACTGAPSEGPPDDAVERRGWERFDLRKHPPSVRPEGAELVARPMLMGDGLIRPNRIGQQRSKHLTGEVHGLEAAAGTELVWRVELGTEPFLAYIPLTRPQGTCRPRYHVRARRLDAVPWKDSPGKDSPWTEVHSHPAVEFERFAPATETVSLEPFADAVIELALSVESGSGTCARPRGLWGGPAVYSRREVGPVPGSAERPNVVLIGLDTVRADALGAYGRRPTLTPAIDRLAAQSDLYLEAFSSFNVTNPSFASILTGLYGKNHGVYDLETPLGEEHRTLAELFRQAGYGTAAVISARHLSPERSGLAQGFEYYNLPPSQYAAEFAANEAIDWIVGRREEPFFLWLHLFDPHTPHTAPRPYSLGFVPKEVGLAPVRSWRPHRQPGPIGYRRRHLGAHEALYDAEVAYLDRQVGRLLDVLGSRGLLETTIVVVVSDHGENLGEHDLFFRHSGLWDPTLHVPLLVRWPGAERAGRRIPGLVQTIDLFPTLLRAAGLEVPEQDGRDLSGGRRMVFAEGYDHRGTMVRTAGHLYFEATGTRGPIAAGPYLFDLGEDPLQTTNLAGRGLAIEVTLGDVLDRWLADRRAGVVPERVPLSDEEREDLRSLGYLGGGS